MELRLDYISKTIYILYPNLFIHIPGSPMIFPKRKEVRYTFFQLKKIYTNMIERSGIIFLTKSWYWERTKTMVSSEPMWCRRWWQIQHNQTIFILMHELDARRQSVYFRLKQNEEVESCARQCFWDTALTGQDLYMQWLTSHKIQLW